MRARGDEPPLKNDSLFRLELGAIEQVTFDDDQAQSAPPPGLDLTFFWIDAIKSIESRPKP